MNLYTLMINYLIFYLWKVKNISKIPLLQSFFTLFLSYLCFLTFYSAYTFDKYKILPKFFLDFKFYFCKF